MPVQYTAPSEDFNVTPLLAITLTLKHLDITGTPASLCPQILARKFSHCPDNYQHIELDFGFTSAAPFVKTLSAHLRALKHQYAPTLIALGITHIVFRYTRCVILLSTHSNDKSGDLQYLPGDPTDPNSGLTATTDNIFSQAFAPIFEFLPDADFMIFLFACGAAVTEPSAIASVQSVVNR